MAGVQRATRRPRLCFIICVSTILLLILCSQALRDRRQEERRRRDILGSTEIPAEHIDPAAIDLTPLVNTLINTSQSGSRQLFSLLSVTSYSSLALHKLTLLVYNISSIKSLESNTFRRRFCYCVTNETNDLTDFTAILLDVMGNSTSYLHELFKSASIISVSQRNNSECIYICVMAGKMGRALPDLWEVGSVTPLFNQTIVEGPHRVGNISSIRLPVEWHQLPNNLSHISPSGMSSVLTSRVQSTAHVSSTTVDETAATTVKITSAQLLSTSPQPATAMPQSQTTADRLETTTQRVTTQRVTTQAVTAAQTTAMEKTTIAQPITSTQPTTILQVPNASVTTAAALTTETAPPTTETAPSTTETAPSTTETAPSTTETAPPTTETAPPTTEMASSTTETAPPTTEMASSTTETAPSTTETARPTTETAQQTTETTSSTTETAERVPPTTGTARQTIETTRSSTETTRPTTETTQPTTETTQPTTETTRPTTVTAPSTTKRSPSTTETDPSTTERAPSITLTAPLITPLSTTQLTTASTNPTTSSPVISLTRLTTATHQPTTKTQRMTSTVHPTRLSTGRPTAGPTEVRRTTGSLSWRTTTPSKSVETEKPGCPWRRPELADIPLSGATTTVGAHKLQPCVLELCKFFSQCLCRPSGNKTRMTRYCDDSHLWYEKHTSEVCRRVRRVSFSRNLKQRCLTKMCSKL